MLTLFAPRPSEQLAVINSTAGDFELRVRTPTYEERLRDEAFIVLFHSDPNPTAIYVQQMQYRIETAVKGWNRVQDEAGEPLDYTPSRLLQLMTQQPDLGPKVARVLTRLFTDLPALGESVAPRSDSGGAEKSVSPQPPCNGTPSSPPSPTSAASSD